ncbi:MAG: SDR family oxidoreductase [Chitinophagaceae bacterium]|nr:SDR family oxidoreductase [Chitinophagaceae bacterium]
MNKPWNEQTGIVTGAASGIGQRIAEQLAQRGVHLALFDRNYEQLLSVAGQLPGKHELFAIDICNEEKVSEAVIQAAKRNGCIDILVNCAGITGKTSIKSHETDTTDVKAVFDINFMGSYFTSKHVLPWMIKNNYGRILHIASIAGKEGNAGMLAYSASKAAVIGMTKVQGKEYGGYNITVNALAPAVIRTAMVDAMPDAQVKYMTDKIPMQRCGTLQEAADMACFIISPENSFSTGFTFDLSGGRATY